MLKKPNHQQKLFITSGARITCNNGTQLDKPVIEWEISLWAVLPIILWFITWLDLFTSLSRYITFQINELTVYIKTLLYWFTLTGGVLWQNGLTMPQPAR